MRSRLLQSFLFVLGFWWIGTALWWSVADPQVNLESLRRTVAVIPWAHLQVPEHVTVLDAFKLQKNVLKLWSGPVIVITVLAALIGALVVWVWALRRHKERAERTATCEGYRGVELSLGALPVPRTPNLQPVALRATDAALKNLTPQQLAALTEVLGLLAANRDAFAGDNQPAGSLLPQTLKATYAALRHPHHPGPAAIAAAAAEIGKITAWKRDEDGSWIRTLNEQREAARTLAALPSWWALPQTERLAILFAVKYRGQVDLLPDVKDPAVYRMARSILDHRIELAAPAAPAAAAVTEAAQTKAYEQRDPEVELFELFEREVCMLPFQTAGLPKNIPAVGWKKGKRAFFLENRLTESLLPKLRPELKAAFTPTREKMRVEPLTAALLKVFHQKGWLVREHGSITLPPAEALWVIQAGKLEFSRVIILDLPEMILAQLPPKDSYYEVTIKRPLFQQPITSSISKDDLMGGMLRPKKQPAQEKPAQEKPAEPARE